MEKLASSKLFDYKDILIISTLDKHPESRPSTKEISNELNIPSRSIRYRLAKLKAANILQEKSIITHERKLGIREHFFIIEENANYRNKFQEILSSNPALSWYVPASGKYNGFLVHALNGMKAPNYPFLLMEKMKETNIISDFYHFELVDYQEIGWNYDFFSSEGNWTWDWNLWEESIKKGKIDIKNDFTFEENPPLTYFDYLDIQILKYLYLPENITQKELGKKLDLSESQISRRIKSMEQNGIIRGYRTGFKPFSNVYLVLCVIETQNNMKKILNHLYQIPYPKTIAYKNSSTICLGIEIPSDELKGLLNGFHLLNPDIDNYFFQIYLKDPIFNVQNSFDLFDQESNSWLNLVKEYEKTIKEYF
ncbi:MAG: Lrp/AsnC family transcriptional regulator [Candidatus Heimdallarchaeota archaeon]|nr:Lrp/AsnC family transcriptional regulator [Candidatus Heimdallarchaeota archaeon]